MIGGSEIGLSSYPAFNSPYEIGDTLQRAGIDLVTTANNHTLDRGVRAIENSIDHWNAIGMPYTGSFLSDEDKVNIRTLTANDIFFFPRIHVRDEWSRAEATLSRELYRPRADATRDREGGTVD